jgi:hypothetical protein
MITYISNSRIDRKKYDATVGNALNTQIYAFSWYLDAVADSWDVLVLNDYKVVMPLPKRKKYGINYIYLLPWVQQLGVFSDRPVDETLIKEFIAKIPKKFVLTDYYFNSGNAFTGKYLKKRTNYILKLDYGIKEIQTHYNTNRKRILKKDFSSFDLDKEGNISDFLEMYRSEVQFVRTPKDIYDKLENLLFTKHPFINIWNVYKNNELLAGLVFLNNGKRITYLLPVASAKAKKYNLPSFIVNELIKEYQKTNLILDFEGSMIKGVADFYRSFGAEKEIYLHYKKKILF